MTLYPAHHGYVYQDLAVACFLAEAIIHGYDEVTVERKFYKVDDFDDLTIRQGEKWIRRQFKHSTSHIFTIQDLQNGAIRLDDLIRSHIGFPYKHKAEYQLCLSWNYSENDPVQKVLRKSDLISLPNLTVSSYEINIEAIWPENGEPIWNELKVADIKRDDFVDLCSRLTIQTDWPKASLDLQSPGTLELLLIEQLKSRIGVGKYPNENRSVEDVASTLIRLATLCRSSGRKITPNEILQQLHLRTDFGRISQQFPLNDENYIHRQSFQKQLVNATSNKIIILTGPPGSGKSWSLTRLEKDLKTSGAIVAKHYCFLEPGDPEIQLRITINSLYGNLIADLIDCKPELTSAKEALYAADADELERILQQAADPEGEKIVLIVDGLDHISRVFSEATNLSLEDIDIINQLLFLELPENVHLVIGSQPGEHLTPLLQKEGAIPLTVPEWTLEDTKLLASCYKLTDQLINAYPDDYKSIVVTLYKRSTGNPLYATYLIKTIVSYFSQGLAFDIKEFLSEAPVLEGDIAKYYEHLLKTAKDKTAPILADLLGLIDFALSEHDLQEIHPHLGPYITKAVNILAPILIKLEGQGGIRIYHESFRRYIVNKLKESGTPFSKILLPVIEWLTNREFFLDSKSYRFLLVLLKRISNFQQVKELVSSTFVIDSIEAGHPRFAIEVNLAIAADVAAETIDWPFLGRIAELTRSLHTCFEEKLLDIELYGRAFASVYGNKALVDRMLFDGKTTVSVREGLVLCSFLADAGEVPPWNEYLRGKIEKVNVVQHDQTQDERIYVAQFHGLIRTQGIEHALQKFKKWLSMLEEPPSNYYLSALLDRIISFSSVSNAIELLELPHLLPEIRRIIRMKVIPFLIKTGKRLEAEKILNKFIHEINSFEALEYLPFGFSHTFREMVIPEVISFDISIGDKSYSPDNNQVDAWGKIINLLAYLDRARLEDEKRRVFGIGWYRTWLLFVIELAELEIIAQSDPSEGDSGIVKALEKLSRDTHPFKGTPRACDLYSIRGLIHQSFRRALLLLIYRDPWEKALAYLRKITTETTTYLSNSPGGPLIAQALIDLLVPYIGNRDISDLLIETISHLISHSEQKGEFYEIHADQEMTFTEVLAKSGDIESAKKHWRKAAQYLSSYGFRKDITIYELLDGIPSVAQLSVSAARELLQKVQPLTNCVIDHTDGSETKHTHNAWFRSLLKTDPSLALNLLSKSLVEYGGVIDWRLEQAINDSFERIKELLPLDLFLLLQCTLPFNHDRYSTEEYHTRIKQCLYAIENFLIKNSDKTIAIYFFKKLLCHAIDDPEKMTAKAFALLSDFAEKYNLSFECHRVSATDSNEPYSRHTPSDWIESIRRHDESQWLPRNASPAQIMAALKKIGIDSKNNDRFINALGYRLIELLYEGKEGQVYLLVDAYAKRLYHDSGRALAALAEGFLRHGYKDIASFTFATAFVYSRGGGGWKVLGSSEHHQYFDKATELSFSVPYQVMSRAIVRSVKAGGYLIGVTSNLIELFAHLQNLDIAKRIWDSAYEVISKRLPDYATSSGPFLPLEVIKNPLSIEEAAIGLLLSRVSHPEYRRKISALCGISKILDKYSTQCAIAIKEMYRFNTPLSSLVSILNVLNNYEPNPKRVIETISEELQELSKSNHFSLNVLSKQLLEKNNLYVPSEAYIVPDDPAMKELLTVKEENLILSIDYENRVRQLSSIDPKFPSFVARRFEYLWDNEPTKERAKSRHRASQKRIENRFTKMLFWEEEILDMSINESAFLLKKTLWSQGKWNQDYEKSISTKISPDFKMLISTFESRINRPDIPRPVNIEISVTDIQILKNTSRFNGWVQVAFYEDELIAPDSFVDKIERELTGMGGVIFGYNEADFYDALPLGNGDFKIWNSIRKRTTFKQQLLNLIGPLVGLDFLSYYRWSIPVFMLPEPLIYQLHLQPASWPNSLKLVDEKGDDAVNYQWWWSSPIGDSIDEEIPRLTGCQLIIRPDIFEQITNKSIYKPRYILKTIRV